MSFDDWKGGLAEICTGFQVDLSSLVDGELDEATAARAMLHLEDCSCCHDFFEDTRQQVRLHKDMADPDRLFARLATLTGAELAAGAESINLAHRLATIFYQLGKAYTLAAIDPGYSERIFEHAVSVDSVKTRGRGFVDGVLAGGKGTSGRVDWTSARHLLNGRLEKIQSPLEKGKRLLLEAIDVDPSHEEARLYLAFTDAHAGRRLKAAEQYREVFDTAMSEANRGLAAVQLGRLYSLEENFKKAILFFRWVTISGLADSDDRFWFARFNLGVVYARMGDRERSLDRFRELLDKHSNRVSEVAEGFARSSELRETIDSQLGFGEALMQRCPEVFQFDSGPADEDA